MLCVDSTLASNLHGKAELHSGASPLNLMPTHGPCPPHLALQDFPV